MVANEDGFEIRDFYKIFFSLKKEQNINQDTGAFMDLNKLISVCYKGKAIYKSLTSTL